MTISLFISLLLGFASFSSVITEAIKKVCENAGTKPSANFIALFNAIFIGGGGTVGAYFIMSIPFTSINIVAIVGMVIAVWLGSMLGYDKVVQLIKQLEK